MADLRDLYQEVILDHSRRPRNDRAIEGATGHAEGYNPLCGDRINIFVKVEGGIVRQVGFEASGCAISKASASMMTESVRDKPLGDVDALGAAFHALVTGTAGRGAESPDIGKLAVFSGVSEFPARVKCAILAWHTLKAALERRPETVSTE